VLNWNSSGQPTQLFSDGKLVSKPSEIAEVQNIFFINKIRNIRNDLPKPIIDPLSVLRSLMSGKNCSFKFSAVHPDEVLAILNGLSNSTLFGVDEIDTFAIKLIKFDILPALTHIVNLSLSTQQFPKDWKKSKAIPLYKKGDSFNPKNYRQVAIIPVLSKVIERVVFNQVIDYLSENKLIHPNHHAYRKGHSTATALL